MKKIVNPQSKMRGYSIVELLVSLAIISIMTAFAVPSLVRSYRSYQMDDAANQVAGLLKFTRYEAIRRNNTVNCLNKPQNGTLTLFTDNIAAGGAGNGVADASERRVVFPPNALATLVDSASVPNSGSLTGVVNGGALTTMAPANGSISFDGRGAKIAPAGASVYWVGNAAFGWRAITVMPSGSIQVWSSATGAWRQLS